MAKIQKLPGSDEFRNFLGSEEAGKLVGEVVELTAIL